MKNRLPNSTKIAAQLLLLLGFSLATIQWLMNRSVWLDEAYLALSILQKSRVELLGELYYHQVAPILFLQFEKSFANLLPNSEIGLRLFPFISYCLSIVLFFNIIHIVFKNAYTRLFALSLFVFNPTLIYYSSEIKQYMSDVLVLLMLFYATLIHFKTEKHKYYWLTALGSMSIFLSNIAPIVLFTEGVYLLYDNWQNKKNNWRYFISMCLAWAIVFAFYYAFFIHNHTSKTLMINYWSNNNGFVPINPLKKAFYATINEKMMTLFSTFWGVYNRYLLIILFLIGNFILIKNKKIGIFCLVFTPIATHWLLSGCQLYPFDLRLVLYLCPVIILAIAVGFDAVLNRLFKPNFPLKQSLLTAFIALLIVLPFLKIQLPIKNEKFKECLKFMDENQTENAPIYVSYYASPPFYYYKNAAFSKATNTQLIVGKYAPTKDILNQEFKDLKGNIWVLFNNKLPIDNQNGQFVVAYFKSMNAQLKKEFIGENYALFLFDLNK